MSLTGNVCRVGLLQKELLPAALNQRVACLRIKDYSLSLRFLFHWLNSAVFEQDAIFSASGIAQKNLSTEWLKSYKIAIPPLSEQQHIVEELDLLSSIIEKKKAQLNELDNLAQSLFYEMFGENSYKKVTLADVVEITSSLVSPLELPYADMLHVSPSNIISNTGEIVDCIKAKEEKLISGKYTFTKGVVLYSKIRPNLNKVAIPTFDGICSADMYPLSVKENATNVFVWRLLLSKDFLEFAIKHSGRARMPKLNRETLYSYRFSLPPLSLQQQFASKIEVIEHQKELIKQSIKEVETLFNSRMDYYFN
jgi:type I restriction enzyme S subunit